MYRAADQFGGLRSQHLGCGGIDEIDPAVGIGSEDAVCDRSEDEFVLLVEFAYPALLGGTRHELADGCAHSFHRGHGLRVFFAPLATEELDSRNDPVSDAYRHSPSRCEAVDTRSLATKKSGVIA